MLNQIKKIYSSTLTQKDYLWDKIIGRPISSVIVYFILPLRITPNQVSVISYLIAGLAGVAFVSCRGYLGLMLATILLYIAYILDCADGQLARIKNMQSEAGHLLDCLIDAAKALIVVCAVSLRIYFIRGEAFYLILGILGMLLVGTSVLLTEFSRRQEYLKISGIRNDTAVYTDNKASFLVTIPERIGKFFIYYPAYLLFFSLIDRMDLFLYIYITTYALYFLRILFSVGIRVINL